MLVQRGLAVDPVATARPVAKSAAGLGSRAVDLDRAKGLAILLVVFGHLVAREDPAGLTWYEPLRVAIYLFHMPFFMYLSGYVAFRYGGADLALRRWPRLAGRRAVRLLLPFLLFGVAIAVAKVVAVRLMPVDNVPDDLWDGLRALVWNTSRSPATSIWYVGVLFVYVVATPLLLALAGGSLWLMVAAAVVTYVLPGPPVLYLDRICHFYLFFVAGGLAALAGTDWLRSVDRGRWPALVLLAALCLYVGSGQVAFDWSHALTAGPYRWYTLAAGLLAMMALHGLVRVPAAGAGGVLAYLGRYCFVIYLLNTIVIGVVKAALLTVLSWTDSDFAAVAIVLMVTGTLGPILIKRMVLAHVPSLDRITD